jgi:DNA-binding response OmpR family regulator
MARILIIDDDPQLRRLLTRILQSESHEVIEASNGADGIARFKAAPSALVITDILMPEKEGIETIRDLRRLAPAVPIIAISGGGASQKSMKFLDMAAKLGATVALAKPFRAPKLLETVARLLSEGAEIA